MNVQELISRVTAPGASAKPAAAAVAAYRAKLVTHGKESDAIAKSMADLVRPIDAHDADERELAELQAERRELRAAILVGDAKDAELQAVDRKIAALRDRKATRGDQAEIARIALARQTAKAQSIANTIMELQRGAPRLYQALLLEQMAERAGVFTASLESFLDAYLEVAAMAHAHDVLCPFSAGSTALRSALMQEIHIPLPAHPAFAQTTDHDLRGQIESRAAELLADVPRIR